MAKDDAWLSLLFSLFHFFGWSAERELFSFWKDEGKKEGEGLKKKIGGVIFNGSLLRHIRVNRSSAN